MPVAVHINIISLKQRAAGRKAAAKSGNVLYDMTPARQRDVRVLALRAVRHQVIADHAHDVHQLLRVERGALVFAHRDAAWVVPTAPGTRCRPVDR